MTITISFIAIPILLTIGLLIAMLRPVRPTSQWDFVGGIFRLFYLIPILFVWVVYFGIAYWLK